MFLIIGLSSSALAQGSIYGTVANSNLTTPANGEITFVGFLDDTDEEIRIETSDGAGYDAGNWFDDFQNYLTEAPGNPYDYYFYNIANNEGFHLAGAIPSNSFQEESVQLAAVAWPLAPTGLTATTVSSSSVVVSWTAETGLTYHVYRRLASSNGSFFRVDNTAGSLADPGEANGYFVDNTVDGASTYSYMLIAQDGSGNYSPHSAIITADAAVVEAPAVDSIVPNHGSAVGGTAVSIYGSGFDMAGVNAVVGTVSLTGITVVSPFRINGTTQAGTVGAANVAVTNLASALAAPTLVGAYTYDANTPPTLAAIGPRTVNEGETLAFTVTASDVDGGFPVLTSTALPGTASFVDNGNGTANFNWATSFTDAGTYNVTFYATDNLDPLQVDSEIVVITVNEAGNQPPVIAPINDTSVVEGGSLFLAVSATDADGEIPTLSASSLPTNATFVDNLDGTGDFNFNPDLTQSGTYNVVFKALDLALDVDSIVVQITVTETNQEPVLAAIGARVVDENTILNFTVTATDGDGTTPVLSTSTPLPGTATFTDNLNGTGTFDWTPTFADQGAYDIMFYAQDGAVPGAIDSELVTITVNDAGNQAPVLDSIPDVVIEEGATLNITVTAADPDATIPALSVINLPANATFGDSANGSGLFTFIPDYTQSGDYTVTFIADDGSLADSQEVLISVTELGNLPPVFDSIGNFAVSENNQLIINVTATDPDGGALMPTLAVSTHLNHYTFVDNGDGTGVLTYNPDFYDAGTDTVTFFAIDFGVPQQTAIAASIITTNETNQAPVFVAVGAVGTVVEEELELIITAYDSTDQNTAHRLYLSAVSPPANSNFVDNGDNTGTFTFTPDSSQIGTVTATFLAVDQGVPQLSTNLVVTINVVVENVPPVIDSIGPQILTEGQTLNLIIESFDPDGGGSAPSLSVKNLPDNANFLDQGTGTGLFSFTPSFIQGGSSGMSKLYYIEFIAYDGISSTKEIVLFQVNDAGDQPPVFDSIPSPSVTEGEGIVITLTGYDPDTMAVTFTVNEGSLPDNMEFEDLGGGTVTFTFYPDYTQSGTYDIIITISDGTSDVTITMTVTVVEAGNQLPILSTITSPQTALEHTDYSFTVYASDPDGDTTVTLSTSTLPGTATFSSNHNVGTFSWELGYEDSGHYYVTFFVFDDAGDSAFQEVEIIVQNVNQMPRLRPIPEPVNPYAENATEVQFAIDNKVYEGDTLLQWIYAYDPDSNSAQPVLSAHIEGDFDTLPTNFTFEDFGDGSGLLTMMPDYTQGLASPGRFYYIVFVITDGNYTDSSWTSSNEQYSVYNLNQMPELWIPDGTAFNLDENANLNFLLFAHDPDRASSAARPTITAGGLPTNSTLINYSNFGDTSIYYFEFNPDYTQAGTYSVNFIAVDYLGGADTVQVTINVIEAGNQTPYFTTVDSVHSIPIGTGYTINLAAFDPDMDSMIISVNPMLVGAIFVDNGDGTCLYNVSSSVFGVDTLIFTVTDYPGGASSTKRVYLAFVNSLRGDLDSNDMYTMNDLVVLIDYLYRGGEPPEVLDAADVDKNGELNIVDITYLIKFLYHNGPPPP
ncbi:MAG: Ig-like domain-containing protein, partial [Candidatus Zixiibacteriota bacterium]